MGHISALEAARENTVPCVRGSCTVILLDVAEYLSKKDENSSVLRERVSHGIGLSFHRRKVRTLCGEERVSFCLPAP